MPDFPNLIAEGRKLGAKFLAFIGRSFGIAPLARFFGTMITSITTQIETFRTENATRRSEIEEIKKTAREAQSESITAAESAVTETKKTENKIEEVKHGEKKKREVDNKQTELAKGRTTKESTFRVQEALYEDITKQKQSQLESREKTAKIRKEGLEKNKKTLSSITEIQERTKPVLKEVAKKTDTMLKTEVEITNEVKAIAENFLEKIKTIHQHEEAAGRATNATSVDIARSAFAMDVVRYQSELAIELLRYKAELEKTKAEKSTKIDKNLSAKLATKETELEQKIKTAELKQEIFIKEIEANIKGNELKEVARQIAKVMKAKSFETIESERAYSAEGTNKAVQNATFFAKDARQNETATIGALTDYINAENPLRLSQENLNNMYLMAHPELSTQPEMVSTNNYKM